MGSSCVHLVPSWVPCALAVFMMPSHYVQYAPPYTSSIGPCWVQWATLAINVRSIWVQSKLNWVHCELTVSSIWVVSKFHVKPSVYHVLLLCACGPCWVPRALLCSSGPSAMFPTPLPPCRIQLALLSSMVTCSVPCEFNPAQSEFNLVQSEFNPVQSVFNVQLSVFLSSAEKNLCPTTHVYYTELLTILVYSNAWTVY